MRWTMYPGRVKCRGRTSLTYQAECGQNVGLRISELPAKETATGCCGQNFLCVCLATTERQNKSIISIIHQQLIKQLRSSDITKTWVTGNRLLDKGQGCEGEN